MFHPLIEIHEPTCVAILIFVFIFIFTFCSSRKIIYHLSIFFFFLSIQFSFEPNLGKISRVRQVKIQTRKGAGLAARRTNRKLDRGTKHVAVQSFVSAHLPRRSAPPADRKLGARRRGPGGGEKTVPKLKATPVTAPPFVCLCVCASASATGVCGGSERRRNRNVFIYLFIYVLFWGLSPLQLFKSSARRSDSCHIQTQAN